MAVTNCLHFLIFGRSMNATHSVYYTQAINILSQVACIGSKLIALGGGEITGSFSFRVVQLGPY